MTAKMTAKLELQVAHNLWVTWGKIAAGHEWEAWSGRREALKTDPVGSFGPEFRASLQAITSAAFALDGWYGATYPGLYAVADRPPGAMNARHLVESIKRASKDRALRVSPFTDDIEWLLEQGGVRGTAVHHQPSYTAGSRHPFLEGDVADEHAVYIAEGASRALSIVARTLRGCLDSPTAALVPWIDLNRGAATVALRLIEARPPVL